MRRPTYRELDNKLRAARELASDQEFAIINPTIVAKDLLELGCTPDKETICELFDEISPDNYVGQRPPMQSYKEEIRDSELFPFVWSSSKLNKDIYIKFAIKNNKLWLVSLHENR